MDIGGWTVGLMRLVNGIPNASACRSLELGMIRCIDEAKDRSAGRQACPLPTPGGTCAGKPNQIGFPVRP